MERAMPAFAPGERTLLFCEEDEDVLESEDAEAAAESIVGFGVAGVVRVDLVGVDEGLVVPVRAVFDVEAAMTAVVACA
jgi:hypothetical protein